MTERKPRRKIRRSIKHNQQLEEQRTLDVPDEISVQNDPAKRVFTEQSTAKNNDQSEKVAWPDLRSYENHGAESTIDVP